MYCNVNKCILSMYVFRVRFVDIFGFSCVYCWDVCVCVCLQQVDTAVIQQVGSALCSLLHHLVLVDDLHCLVINAQPAVKTNVEDIRGVMTSCCAVPMVIDNCLS